MKALKLLKTALATNLDVSELDSVRLPALCHPKRGSQAVISGIQIIT